jgi:GT2 family glycosyltransferase
MLSNYPKVAIIYLSFHSEPYIDDVVSALKKITYPKDKLELVIVDNPHPQYGPSVRFLNETVMPLSGNELPHVTILPQTENLGFASGNNAGIKWAIDNGFDYVYFHNNDGFVTSDFLEPLVEAMENDKKIGAAQSLIMMYPETELINTSGNVFQYLGIGFCNDFRKKRTDIDVTKNKEINYASGAAMLMKVDLLQQFGTWDDDFFLYHEDVEYSFRLKIAGFKIVVVPNSIFYHKYSFSRNKEKFYYIERNRYGVMLMFFKIPTLLLFLPIGLALEFGLILFSLKSGWIKEKMSAYKYWLSWKNWQLWLKKRKYVQSIRQIKDKELIKDLAGKVEFEDKSINNPLLKYVGNPLMNAYWQIIKRIIFW